MLNVVSFSGKKEHLKKSCTEYDTVMNEIIYLEALQNEKIGREVLIDDSIERWTILWTPYKLFGKAIQKILLSPINIWVLMVTQI